MTVLVATFAAHGLTQRAEPTLVTVLHQDLW
jgi:hypothetical protein